MIYLFIFKNGHVSMRIDYNKLYQFFLKKSDLFVYFDLPEVRNEVCVLQPMFENVEEYLGFLPLPKKIIIFQMRNQVLFSFDCRLLTPSSKFKDLVPNLRMGLTHQSAVASL